MFSSPLPDMDFHSRKRKQLQALCKKHNIPANLTNLEMANNLASLLKEKGKLMIRGQSCTKGEPVSENDSNGVIRHLKKVRFNPENETIEFADSRVTRRKTIAKPMVKKGELVIDRVDNIEASWRIGESQVRTTRTRGQKLVSGGVIEVALPLADKKRKRMKGVISESAEGNDGERVGKTDLVSHLSDNLESESVDAEEIRMQVRRSLRNQYVPISKNSDDVEKDCQVLKKNQTTLKKILETNAEISMDTGLGGECRIVQPVKAVRHSKRIIRKIEDYGLRAGIDPITSKSETDQTEYSKEAGGRNESITKSHSLATDTDRQCFEALGTSTKEILVSELRLSGDDEMQEEEMRSSCNDVATVPVIQLTVVTEANHNDTCIKPSQEQTEMNQELSLIKSKCQAAITAHTGGNPNEAFSLMDEMGCRYENCGLVYGAQYRLHALEASRIKTSDGALFQKHVRSAVESARQALSLSPNSTEFWTFYAQALLKLSSSDDKGLDDALRECERALSIENPLEHCRDASLSLKAMLWEERCESESSRMSERKKQAVLEEIVSAMVKMGKLRMYWNAMSEETKMGLIGPRIGDLREYYSSLCEDGSAKRVFSEGIGYSEKNKNWKFWPCYYCDEKFEHYEMRMKHIERKHEGVIGQNLQIKPYLFPEIDADGGGSEVYHNLEIVNGTIYIIKERIVLTGDSSCPLDDRLLRVEVMPHRHHDGVENDENGSASPCSICDSVVLPVPPDIDAFGQWLFAGPPTSTAEELASWTHLQHQMKHEGTEAPKRFKDEFNRFQALRSRQSELMVQCRCLQAIQIICAQELGKREKGREHVHQSYKSLLKEGSMSTEKRSMLNTITGVLTQAENNRHYPLESNEFEDQEDASIRMTIHQKLKPNVSELCRNEARITRCSAVMWRLSVIYKQASLDYRSIMLPLMRNSIHAKLEALIYGGEEKQKTDAATEALLSLLALDTKKNTSQGSCHSQSEILL